MNAQVACCYQLHFPTSNRYDGHQSPAIPHIWIHHLLEFLQLLGAYALEGREQACLETLSFTTCMFFPRLSISSLWQTMAFTLVTSHSFHLKLDWGGVQRLCVFSSCCNFYPTTSHYLPFLVSYFGDSNNPLLLYPFCMQPFHSCSLQDLGRCANLRMNDICVQQQQTSSEVADRETTPGIVGIEGCIMGYGIFFLTPFVSYAYVLFFSQRMGGKEGKGKATSITIFAMWKCMDGRMDRQQRQRHLRK
ncbi:hypothetical protein BS50DRAFT_2091 [Corynespora cassiicola Philippines]|uniref:Uncharacterized protein n=1 Tax=Corynespora cassiicola Philippines TaxID=1448308 RepID=A0A2T2P8H0_CORCC|nr:hypothetical protein BS50DRAFT_2091 [Corynespora cassiicola Philippines]